MGAMFYASPHQAVAEVFKTIKVSNDQPYTVLGFARMLRTEKGEDVHNVIHNQSAFQVICNTNLDLDVDGKYDYWFLFRVFLRKLILCILYHSEF